MTGTADINKKTLDQQVLSEEFEDTSNVVKFSSTLRELRKEVVPELVKQRAGWRDNYGRQHFVDYVEWHTVADILDSVAPNWGHQIKDVRMIGDLVLVTVAITIDGVTREGIGTGSAKNERGIKKAEHDGLKRAAVKFGIARELYKREFSDDEAGSGHSAKPVFAGDPIASSISEMVTPKQLGMIRAVAREAGVDAEIECEDLLKCKVAELSRRAASALIDHLGTIVRTPVEVKKAG